MPKKNLTGKVFSTKMAKTAIVGVESIKAHPLYKKRMKRVKKYKVHNDIGAKDGDTVIIEEFRPLSKDKRFRVIRIFSE